MDTKFKVLLIVVGIVVFMLSAFIAEMAGLEWMRFIGVKKANIRREMFQETKSYNSGMEQNLIKYYHEYNMSKTIEEKNAIISVVRMMYAEYDETKLNSQELIKFLKKIKYGVK